MAKAQFHKNQRVYVKTVGTWAPIEKVMPQWAKGLDEPLRIFYDVGLGREFLAEELQLNIFPIAAAAADAGEQWRLVRSPNKWKPADECAHHPYPGTHPQILTGETDWGGWRVPGAEYDLYPERVERQARMIAYTPKVIAVLQALIDQTEAEPEDVPDAIAALVREAKAITRYIEQNAQ